MGYRIVASRRGEGWVARAERDDTCQPFGIECAGATEGESVERMSRWLEWQVAHSAALEVLQSAERAYHRTVASRAFVTASASATSEPLWESLQAVNEARIRLDDIRSRRPE